MANERLHIKMDMKIAQSIDRVFEAVIHPEAMSHYFITTGSGPLEEGKTITWTWADFNHAQQQIVVEKVVTPSLIMFQWAGSGFNTRVTLNFEALDAAHTLVKVTEDGWENDTRGIQCLAENTKGWTGFLLGLKAYLLYGINLRK